MTEEIIKQVEAIINPVYLVGGSVRDLILGKEPKDYDFTTPLSPDEVEIKVKAAGRRAYTVGKKFGTIGFKVADKSNRYQYIEVTTFRRERYEVGNRKPQVEFVSDLKEDLSRRDFTINAIALDTNGEYFDPFGGRLDILAEKIKAVGSAKDRFKEDPLRMLRAVRFATVLNFDIDPNMIGVMRKMSPTILNISRERWVQELDKILSARRADLGLEILADTNLLKYMLPEIWIQTTDYDHIWKTTLGEVISADNTSDDGWAALLKTLGMPYAETEDKDRSLTWRNHNLIAEELAKGICLRLKLSNDRTSKILDYVKKST